MSMFSRMSDIIQANINAMLDKAEDPQKVIRLIVQEMEETMVELRSVAARHLAEKKHLERKVSAESRKMDDWQTKAELAMQKGRDDLARAALIEKHQAQQKLEELQTQFATLDEAVDNIQQDCGRLNEKLAEARSKQKTLAMRKESAAVRLKAKTKQQEVNIDRAISKFELYERRIDDLEAQVDAFEVVKPQADLAAQITQLQTDDNIEKELDALRKKVA